jgi:outer membrane protein TolC
LRAAAAQKLKNDLNKTIADANQALKNSQKVEKDGLKTPIEALRYQKSLLDNVKILETIDQELATAKIELNQLINLPATANYKLEDPDKIMAPNPYSNVDPAEFELRALMYNADLNESLYNARIAVEETRKSLLKLIPGISFNIGPQTTNNSYWINKNWVEGAASVSFNLWNLLAAPGAIKLADQNKELAQQKRMMVQMAVISQVYLAKMGLESSLQLYRRSAEIDQVDSKISKITADKEKEGAASQAERVAADASAIISKLRKYQALSQLFAASGKMQATAGLEPDVTSLNEIGLKDLTNTIKVSFDRWNSGKLPPLPVEIKPDQAVSMGTISPADVVK